MAIKLIILNPTVSQLESTRKHLDSTNISQHLVVVAGTLRVEQQKCEMFAAKMKGTPAGSGNRNTFTGENMDRFR